MRRRTCLAAAGTVLAGLAGCSSGGSDEGALDPDCNELVESADVTVCQGDDEDPVSVGATEEEWAVTTGDGDVETIDFEVSNRSDGPLAVASPAWVLKRRDGEGWTQVAEDDGGEASSVQPDATHTWSFSLEPRPASGDERRTNETVSIDDGIYAFVFQGTLDDGRSVGAGAAFELVSQEAQQGTGSFQGP